MMVQPHPDAPRQQHRYFRTVATRRLPVDRGNMAVAALLKEKPKPTNADVDAAITNICRCGTFQQRELIWSREEDMLHGQFHPLTQAKLLLARLRLRPTRRVEYRYHSGGLGSLIDAF